MPTLTGNYGVLAAPRIVKFQADDPDDFDEVYSVRDTLTLTLKKLSALTLMLTQSICLFLLQGGSYHKHRLI